MPTGIVIVGLGPGSPEQITLQAWRTLEGAGQVYLRTRHHPVVPELPQSATTYESFDQVYEQADTFDDVYTEIARRVVELGQRPEGVVYAVPGDPMIGEISVQRILALAKEADLSVRVVPGVSFLQPTVGALGVDPFDGLQICDATLLAQQLHPNLNPDVGALIVQLYSRELAADVKMTLMHLYHDDQPVRLVRSAGTPQEVVREFELYRLDRQQDLDHLSSLYIPPLQHPGSIASFEDIVARLRAPDGCPWDREQTHQTLRNHLLEETYEVLEALDADNMEDLQEELGDLLLQILLHAQIAVEDGDFKLIDSVSHIIEKLIRRHPHVFGQVTAKDSEDVLRQWEEIKRAERGAETFKSMLAGISTALPSLSRAMEMQRRAARVGFDWPSREPVVEKVVEEINEFLDAPDRQSQAGEFGDLLFSLVNLARWHDIDAESSLRETTKRFARRFGAIEQYAFDHGLDLQQMNLEEMDSLWERAKRDEREQESGA